MPIGAIALLLFPQALALPQGPRPSADAADEPACQTIPDLVTEEIEAGIRGHIAGVCEANDGRYPIEFEGKTLELKLVRVHLEYLSTLSPGRHFACVDLAGTDGNVYDVDFFLAGEAGNLEVTETTVHKVNGRPNYLWEQEEDDTWHRVEATDASRELLGVVEGSDTFDFIYQATLPALAATARMWLPIPSTDEFQQIEGVRITAPVPHRLLTDEAYGNTIAYFEFAPEHAGATVELACTVTRREKGPHEIDAGIASRWLAPEALVPAAQTFEDLAAGALSGAEPNDLERARKLYDHTIARMRYMKFGEGFGRGDAVRACDSASGNCTDYHAYFIALARASGIPARFAIGAAIPADRDGGGVDGYHCWAEFFADGKWWPVDVSEADKYDALSTYYFGHNGANRVELSRGRDLVVDPLPASGPINFLAYPVLEVEGKPAQVRTRFGFRRSSPPQAESGQ